MKLTKEDKDGILLVGAFFAVTILVLSLFFLIYGAFHLARENRSGAPNIKARSQ
ncbi:MAG TPA: hypothetical protein VIL74_09135 [Pyrinomonadaceae bacterium]|jgi:hypothetical protein